MSAPENVAVLNTVLKAVPYPHMISDVDTHTQPDVVRFTWRGARYRVDGKLHCEEVRGAFLHGSELAILMQRVLQMARTAETLGRRVVPA